MTTWNIGIDETGKFDCFAEDDKSFVCAVVTRKNEEECEKFLKGCAKEIDLQKYKEAFVDSVLVNKNNPECDEFLKSCAIFADRKKYEELFPDGNLAQKAEPELRDFLRQCALNIDAENYQETLIKKDFFLEKIIRSFFHASDVRLASGQDFLNRSMELVRDNEIRKEYFEKIFISSENTEFVGNRQNYYLNSLYEILGHVFESGLFKKNDSVKLFIAQRALDVIGYEYPVDIVVSQLMAKKNSIFDKVVVQDIEKAVDIICKYGNKQKKHTDESGFGNLEELSNKEKEYLQLLMEYHYKLSKSLKKFLKSSYPHIRISVVQCQSANNHVFPALADIAATLVNSYGVDDYEVAKKRSLVKGYNVKAFIESGETDEAARLIGTLFFDTPKNAKTNLDKLFESVTSRNYDNVWKILTDLCTEKMRNRGTEGEDFLRTGKLIELLDDFIDRFSPSPIVCARYAKMKGEYAQHSGSIDLDAVGALAKKIKGYLQVCTSKDEYAELSCIEEEFWVESYAQVRFNSYDFSSTYYEQILEDYNAKIKQDPFYAKIDIKKDPFTDKRYSVICGTVGQALAFSGKHDEAINYFLEDYNHSNYMRNLPSSFLVVEYLRKGDLENAVKWFEIQQKEVLGELKTMEQFSHDLNGDEKIDNWLVLNFLRIWAYSMKVEKPIVKTPVSLEKWIEREFDAYPGGVVLKWAAICNECADGPRKISVELLNKSIEVMRNAPEFTINSLALSPIKILNVLGEESVEKYAELYKDLCDRCESFAAYAKANPVLDPKASSKDIWDAAMILPFNYA